MSKDEKIEEVKVLTEEEKKEKKLAVSGLAPTSAGIDIFNIEPTKISRDLRGKFLCLYGDEKVGKTTFGIRAQVLYYWLLKKDITPLEALNQ